MAEKRLFKEYNQLIKNDPHKTNHQILTLVPKDPENIYEWQAVICKPSKADSNYYYNGQWKLEITVSRQYPISPPVIKFDKQTPISHPNIDYKTGEICLDILKSENWSPAWNLEHLVVAILMLIDDPEPDSPLNIDSANLFRYDRKGFESYVQFEIWRNGTFFAGKRDVSGVREGEEQSEEEEEGEGEAEEQEQEEPVSDQMEEAQELVPEISKTVKTPEVPALTINPTPNPSSPPEDPNAVNVIKEVGEQITKQFMDKVDEIKHSKANSEHSIDSAIDYSHAKQQIIEKVDKQVKELCSKSVSPVAESPESDKPQIIDTETNTLTETNPIVRQTTLDDEKAKFLTEVNLKIEEHNSNRKRTEEEINSPNSMDRLKKSLSLKSISSRSSDKSKRQLAKEKFKSLVKH